MIDVFPNHGKQVPEPTVNRFDPFRELGQPRREFREPLRFKRSVDNDAAASPQSAPHSELMNSRRGSLLSVAKNLVMFRLRVGLSLHVN